MSDIAKLRTLEDENAKLKRLLADTMLDNGMLSPVDFEIRQQKLSEAGV